MEILQQQPAGQPAQQQPQPQPAEKTPAQERQELDEYRKGLLNVHNQLKPQADLIQHLREQGITDVTGLKARLQHTPAPAPKAEETKGDEIDTATSVAQGQEATADSEREEMKAEIEKLRDMVGRQDLQMRTDRLQNQIKEQIANKPEYALLGKMLDQQVAYGILNEMNQDQKANRTYDMAHYLQKAEGNLRNAFERMGGKLEQGTAQPTGDMGQHQTQTQQQQAPVQATTQALPEKKNPGEINFPSLPSTSAGSVASSPEQLQKSYLEKGRHPVTGKIDENVAFNKELEVFMRENPEPVVNA